jgi:uncharacterized protein YndB with AHSA1/START domain
MTQKIEKKIFIEAQAAAVWKALIKPDLIKRWMAEPEIGLQVSVDWTEGSIISMQGFHHIEFENRGIVLKVDPENELRYSCLSSLSQLPDHPDNYSIINFKLNQSGNDTEVVLTITNFPTESIFRHVELYWQVTLVMLKQVIETSIVQRV